MRHTVFILSLVAFLASSWANIVHAEAIDISCSHTTSETQPIDQFCVDDNHEQSQVDLEHCVDCCCHHVHVLAKQPAEIAEQHELKKTVTLPTQDKLLSTAIPPLFKPPII